MTTPQIAARLVELVRQGQFETAQRELYASDAESIEPTHSPGLTTVKGLDQIIQKGAGFRAMIEEIHGLSSSDAVIAGNYFSISMDLDVTLKGMGRISMIEIAVYLVKDGKIVLEHFFY